LLPDVPVGEIPPTNLRLGSEKYSDIREKNLHSSWHPRNNARSFLEK
jgi:hypothetical protein